MHLKELYTSLLASGFIEIGDGDRLFHRVNPASDAVALSMGGTALYLSSETAAPHPEKRYIHPLVEPLAGSDVSTWLYTTYTAAAHVKIMNLFNDCVGFCASKSEHATSTPASKELLRVLATAAGGDITEKMCKDIAGILVKAMERFKLVQFNAKANAKIDGKNYPHACITTFPMYEELTKERPAFNQVVTRKQRDLLIALYEYFLPGLEIANAYSRGPTIDAAPRFSSLMCSVYEVLQKVNDGIEQISTYSGNSADIVASDLSWYNYIGDQARYMSERLGADARLWHDPNGTRQPQQAAPATPATPASDLAAQAAQLRRSNPPVAPPAAPQAQPVRELPATPGGAQPARSLSVSEYLAQRNQAQPQHRQDVMRTPDGRTWVPAAGPAAYPQAPVPPAGAVAIVTHHINGQPYWVDANNVYLSPAPAGAAQPAAPVYQHPGYAPQAPQPQWPGQYQPPAGHATGWTPMPPAYPSAMMMPQQQFQQPQPFQQPMMANPAMMSTGFTPTGAFGRPVSGAVTNTPISF
jgi:hypothetical protein